MKNACFFILVLLAAGLSSCRREVDEVLPEVEFLSPDEGHQYDVFDSIHVYIKVSDNEQLSLVKISVVDVNLSPVLTVVSQSHSGQHAEIGFEYPIDNIRITTGSYFLLVEVRDANNNIKHAYRNINITEVPRALKGFFAVTQPMPSTVNLHRWENGNLSLWNSFSSDFSDLEVSSYWQQVYVAGSYFGLLRAMSIDGSTPGWSKTPVSSSSPYWGPMSVSGPRLYASVRGQGQVKAYNEDGTFGFFGNVDNNFYPDNQLQAGPHIFLEEKEISSAARRIMVFATAGGSLQQTVLSIDVMEFFEKDADNIYAIGNDVTQGHLLIYDFLANGFWEPIALPAGTVTAAAQVNSETLLIAMSDGNIYEFTYNPVGLLSLAGGINTVKLEYDPVQEQVFSAEGSTVKIYSYNPFLLQNTVTFPEAVKDVELWFNR
jgi:hypothetical protein